MTKVRQADVDRLYDLLGRLVAAHPPRRLAAAAKSDGWPERGIYFFFEPGELREDGTPRVVRIGTHALKEGATSTLWGRLAQHRGTITPKGGAHRSSIFRTLVGTALAQDALPLGWGDADAQRTSAEQPLEAAVSDHIGAMEVVWLDIPDDPGPQSLRGVIERGAIALLSNLGKAPIDPASAQWLGHRCNRSRVRGSGLWNNNHVDEDYDPAFLDRFEDLIGERPIYVIQCAKSKREDGFWREAGAEVTFVAHPDLSPDPDVAHPDDQDAQGTSYRQKVADYNRVYRETGRNPMGLRPAAELYTHPTYAELSEAFPPDRLYILSAGWGLVRSDTLLPNYDVTFSAASGAPPCSRRHNKEDWDDFNELPTGKTPLVFIGGKSYLEPFAYLTRSYPGHKSAWINTVLDFTIPGVELRRFETDGKTNWHYELARALIRDERTRPAVPPLAPTSSPPASPRQSRAPKHGNHGRYEGLFTHLSALAPTLKEITLSFAEIEGLIGSDLPPSARKYQAWWVDGAHGHSKAWTDAGFRKTGHRFTEPGWVRFSRG